MADFYTGIAGTVSKLVNKFGKTITIHRKSGGTFNPATGLESSARTQAQRIKAVVLPASSSKIAALDLVYNLSGMQFTKLNYCIVPGSELSWIPKPGDNILIGTEKWTLIGATPLNPNDGKPITYEMAFRI